MIHDIIAIIHTSAQSYWLSEACKIPAGDRNVTVWSSVTVTVSCCPSRNSSAGHARFNVRPVAKMSSAPKENSCNSTANKTAPPPSDDRSFEEKMAASKTYDEALEHYWEDYEENPDYWESDEDYIGG